MRRVKEPLSDATARSAMAAAEIIANASQEAAAKFLNTHSISRGTAPQGRAEVSGSFTRS